MTLPPSPPERVPNPARRAAIRRMALIAGGTALAGAGYGLHRLGEADRADRQAAYAREAEADKRVLEAARKALETGWAKKDTSGETPEMAMLDEIAAMQFTPEGKRETGTYQSARIQYVRSRAEELLKKRHLSPQRLREVVKVLELPVEKRQDYLNRREDELQEQAKPYSAMVGPRRPYVLHESKRRDVFNKLPLVDSPQEGFLQRMARLLGI